MLPEAVSCRPISGPDNNKSRIISGYLGGRLCAVRTMFYRVYGPRNGNPTSFLAEGGADILKLTSARNPSLRFVNRLVAVLYRQWRVREFSTR